MAEEQAAAVAPQTSAETQANENTDLSQNLNEKLKQRPSVAQLEQQNIISNAKVSSAIAGSAHNLEKNLTRRASRAQLEQQNILRDPANHPKELHANALNDFLASRPSTQDLQNQNLVYNPQAAHALQPAAHSLAKQLGSRPQMNELAARNIISQDGSSQLESTGRIRRASQALNSFLNSRPQEYEVPHSYYQDHSHVEDAGKEQFRRTSVMMNDLLANRSQDHEIPSQYFMQPEQPKQTRRKKSEDYNSFDALFEQQFTAMTTNRPKPHEIPNRYFQAPPLATSAEAELLSHKLKSRQSRLDLQNSGILPAQSLPNSIAGIAFALEQKLGRKPNVEDLVNVGVSQEYLNGLFARSLAPAANSVNKLLSKRMTQEELERRHILHQQSSPQERHERMSQMINPVFQQRKNRNELNQNILTGGISDSVSHAIRPAAHQLEKNLKRRRDSNALYEQNILKYDPSSSEHYSLQKYRREQEESEKRQALEKQLSKRTDLNELKRTGIVKGGSALAQRQRTLEQHHRKRRLSDALQSRKEHHEIPNKYFMEPKRKKKKQKDTNNRRKSEYMVNSMDDLGHLMRERPQYEQIPNQYFQEAKQPTQRELFAEKFANRQSHFDLHARGILPTDYTKGDHHEDHTGSRTAGAREALTRNFQRRQSRAELQSAGILHQDSHTMAQSMQPAAAALDKKLRRRPSVDMLQNRNILKKDFLSPQEQAQKDAEYRQKIMGKLANKVSSRPQYRDLVQRGYVDKNSQRFTPEQVQRRKELQRKMRQGTLSDILANRPQEHEVNPRYFVEANNAPSRQRTYSQFMTDSVSNLNDMMINRKQEHEISAHVFKAPSKKRRFSASQEQMARQLESKLFHRPTKDDIKEDMWLTARDQQGQRGRGVSMSMKQNQDMLSQIYDNRLEHYQIKENVFRQPTNQDELAFALRNRMKKEELIKQGLLTKHTDFLAGAAKALESKFARRPTMEALHNQNVLNMSTYNMPRELIEQRKDLDWKMKQHKLTSHIQYRPSKEELAEKAILDDSGLAPRLHGTALKLNQKMGRRSSKADLFSRGILSNHDSELSRALIPAAHSLERKLQRRMSKDLLESRGYLDSKGRSANVYNMSKDIKRRRTSRIVQDVLERRPNREQLIAKGIMSGHNVAPSLQGAAHGLTKFLKRRPSQVDIGRVLNPMTSVTDGRYTESLEDHLATRPLPSDLKRKQILPGVPINHKLDEYQWIENRSDLEELNRKKREARNFPQPVENQNVSGGISSRNFRRMSMSLSQALSRRPEKETLAERGLLDTSGLAPRLHPAALSVQQNMTERMSRDELLRRGILSGMTDNGMSAALAPAAHNLASKLRRRPSVVDVANMGYLDQRYAQERESKQDQRRRVSMSLSHHLTNRPTKESLADRAILDDSFLAPSLHPAAVSLQTNLMNQAHYQDLVARGIISANGNVANALQSTMHQLQGRLKRRQSKADLQSAGYLHSAQTNLANSLAGSARNLEKKLRRRPSVDMLKQRGIMNEFAASHLPPEMIQKAMQQKRKTTERRVEDLLSNRPQRDELNRIIPQGFNSRTEVANSLQAAGNSLSKKLRRRPSVDMLQQRNILRNYGLPVEMSQQANQLAFTSRQDNLAHQMRANDATRRRRDAAEKFGLPTNIATEDHIKQILEMNMAMMGEIRTMGQQINVLQSTCNELLVERRHMKSQMQNYVSTQEQEISDMKDFIRSNLTTLTETANQNRLSVPVPQSGSRGSFRVKAEQDITELKNSFSQATMFYQREQQAMQEKELAFKAYMLDNQIELARLKGEYEIKIEQKPAGIKFGACDGGKNLCVQAVLSGSAAQNAGVLPGDVVVRIRNIGVENQDAGKTLEIYRNEDLPIVVTLRKQETHEQLKELWKEKRVALAQSSTPQQPAAPVSQPGGRGHKRKESGLIRSEEINSLEQLEAVRKEMEAEMVHLKDHVGKAVDPIVRAFAEMDTNGNGDLSGEEFVNGLYRLGLAEALSENQMVYSFRVMDDDESGFIDFVEFEYFLKHAHEDDILKLVQQKIRERVFALMVQGEQEKSQKQEPQGTRYLITAEQVAVADNEGNLTNYMYKGDEVVVLEETNHNNMLVGRTVDGWITLVDFNTSKQNVQKLQDKNYRDIKRAQSEQAASAIKIQQYKELAEREAVKEAMQQKRPYGRRNSAEGNNPKAWVEQLTPEDQERVTILTQTLVAILSEAKSWETVIETVRTLVPNLEYKIAEQLYPVFKDRTQLTKKEIMNHALHIVDVFHSRLAPPEARGAIEEENVPRERRYSKTPQVANAMGNLRAGAQGGYENEDSESSDEEYDFGDPAVQEQASQGPSHPKSVKQIEQEMEMTASMSKEFIEKARSDMDGAGSLNFDEMDNTYSNKRQPEQEAMGKFAPGLQVVFVFNGNYTVGIVVAGEDNVLLLQDETGQQHQVFVSDVKTMEEMRQLVSENEVHELPHPPTDLNSLPPPESQIDRRKSTQLIAATEKPLSRPSLVETEELQAAVEDKRAPETPKEKRGSSQI